MTVISSLLLGRLERHMTAISSLLLGRPSSARIHIAQPRYQLFILGSGNTNCANELEVIVLLNYSAPQDEVGELWGYPGGLG